MEVASGEQESSTPLVATNNGIASVSTGCISGRGEKILATKADGCRFMQQR